jgi:hypothetical protein
LNALKFLRNFYFCHFSKPVADRALYRLLRKTPMKSLVEIGLGNLTRTKRLLEFALDKTPLEELRYAGIDLFEGRSAENPGVPLKQAHKQLKPLGIRVQLLPGDPLSALARSANALTKTDLLIVSADVDADSLAKAWFYVPRMLHDQSIVLVEERGETPEKAQFRQLKRLEIEQLASGAARTMRRAA